LARHWWLTSIILATQEEEIRRIKVQSQPGQKFVRLYLEKTQKKAGYMAQVVGPEFKPQQHTHKIYLIWC
jgi:hypothetical protein